MRKNKHEWSRHPAGYCEEGLLEADPTLLATKTLSKKARKYQAKECTLFNVVWKSQSRRSAFMMRYLLKKSGHTASSNYMLDYTGPIIS
ncbi:MAG: hypothetical protein ABR542_09910 [Desulfonatronovibrio sp.]|nr:hypothetical protein [Desulfovibrionales bacterium]